MQVSIYNFFFHLIVRQNCFIVFMLLTKMLSNLGLCLMHLIFFSIFKFCPLCHSSEDISVMYIHFQNGADTWKINFDHYFLVNPYLQLRLFLGNAKFLILKLWMIFLYKWIIETYQLFLQIF